MNSDTQQPTIHLLIAGYVQGVGFRYSTKRKAAQLGLSGWVKNRKDGRVELVAQGQQHDLEAFQQWCQHGPANARVTDCELLRSDQVDTGAGFRIVYEE